jgi:hypothetical protein
MVKVAAATNRRRKNSFTWWDVATLKRTLDRECVRDLFNASRSRGAEAIYWMNSSHFWTTASAEPQGMIGTDDVEFFGEPSISLSE